MAVEVGCIWTKQPCPARCPLRDVNLDYLKNLAQDLSVGRKRPITLNNLLAMLKNPNRELRTLTRNLTPQEASALSAGMLSLMAEINTQRQLHFLDKKDDCVRLNPPAKKA